MSQVKGQIPEVVMDVANELLRGASAVHPDKTLSIIIGPAEDAAGNWVVTLVTTDRRVLYEYLVDPNSGNYCFAN